MNYSLDKIAKELGISKTTVSLILNGHASENRISAELEKTVKDFCRSVNYVPNIHAVRAGSKYAKNIGLLINENLLCGGSNPFSDQNTSEITGGIVAAAAKKSFRVTIQFYNENTRESEVFRWFRDREIDGLIYYGYSFDENWLRCFRDERRCVVGIGTKPADGISTINIDNADIMYKLCERIIKKGKRKFMYISGNEDSYVSAQRLLGVKNCLSVYNIPFDESNIINADFSENIAFDKIMDADITADAIICANDDMAIGTIKALVNKGIAVPEQIFVTGADNIRISEYFSPSVTTINNMNNEMGKCAFKEVLSLIKGGEPKDVIVKSKIVLRESC